MVRRFRLFICFQWSACASARQAGSEEPASSGKDAASGVQPWELAEEIRSALFDARSELLLEGNGAERDIQAAEAALKGPLRAGLAADSPAELAELEDGDEIVLTATARGRGGRRIGLGECRGRITPAR